MFKKKGIMQIEEQGENKKMNNSPQKEFLFSKVNPITLFPNNLIAARFWCWAFFVMLFIALVEPIPYFVMINNRERVVIMDQAGQFIVAPLESYYNATPISEFVSKLAAKSLLNRNPSGFDEPDLLRQIYLKPMYKIIMEQQQKVEEKFKARDIHQKCEIMKVDILQKAQGYVMARIKGQLIRGGIYKGQSYTEGFKFILDLKLDKNPRLGNNQRLPYAVSWFSIKTQEMKKGA
jgi:hypothetical protein